MTEVEAKPSDDSSGLGLDPIVMEARKRFRKCVEWESNWRTKFVNDMRFANGDSDNGYQWPNAIRQSRDTDNRPCLTINVVRQHNLIISNEMRKNKSSVKFLGMGNGATQESANVVRDIYRHIEYISNAQSAYTTARDFMIAAGKGYWRVVTDYAHGDTMDQEIFIRPIKDPLSVYLDLDIVEHDGSDARFGFIFDDVPKEDFEAAYPELKDVGTNGPLGVGSVQDDWISNEKIRVCEYFRKVPKEDQLVSFVHGGRRHQLRRSKLHADMYNSIVKDPQTLTRIVYDEEIEWYLIVGEQIADRTTWPGRFIPIVRCVGEEMVINGIYDCKGHTRAMKDSQRMYNYNASAQIEFVALQNKVPYIGAIEAIEEYEPLWNTANMVNHSYLPFKSRDNQGNEIPAPARQQPPAASPGYQQGMETAFQQMMMTSGQWQNQMGMNGNERTGAAIQKRQDQGDTATYHFNDNYAEALKYTGRIILDLIPKVYDTKRTRQIIGEDGIDYELEIDPGARQAFFQHVAHNGQVVKRVLNPALGRYDVASDVGPEYGSKRDETKEAIALLLTQAPGLTNLIGDLFISSLDFDKAQEAAIRLKRMVPPQALGNGPTPAEQQLQQQVMMLQAELAKLLELNAKDKLKLAGKAEMRDIEVYEAETKRMTALQKMLPMDAEGLKGVIGQLLEDALSARLDPILKANAPDVNGGMPEEGAGESPPIPGAQRASDGNWYIGDPTRPGKYLHVKPKAAANG